MRACLVRALVIIENGFVFAYDIFRNISDKTGGAKIVLLRDRNENLLLQPVELAALLNLVIDSAGRFNFLQSVAENSITIIKKCRSLHCNHDRAYRHRMSKMNCPSCMTAELSARFDA